MNPELFPNVHPVVASWFDERFANGPTPPQAKAWPEIAGGADVLVASPTGSGKTLTAFLVGINDFFLNPPASQPDGPSILYLSPLRALATDIRHNLQRPLRELTERAVAAGLPLEHLRAEVRTGDTSPYEKQQQVKKPPHIYVTTPESLYIMLTSASGRNILRHVRTVIVDEIHAIAHDKRGSHLTLSLERLERLTMSTNGWRPQRIGLSATQRPLSLIASFLGGVDASRRPVTIVDCDRPRDVDFAIELPPSELEAVMSTEQWNEVLANLAEHVVHHHTTLIFVQSRRLAERLAHQLSDVLTDSALIVDAEHVVAAHHGSMSLERRSFVESQLRNGNLRALVATASLELGIDVGPVDLVVQIGSPRAIATFLQRAGRANHHVGGRPKARLYPLNRHELVESVALLDAVDRGELDVITIPQAPLDVLTQQLIAEVVAQGEDSPDDLYALFTRAAPFHEVSRETFDEVLTFTSTGIFTGKGVRGAQLHYDPINQSVRPRASARMAAIMNGGTIPDLGDYNVILDPDNVVVGQLSEDFAIESAVGDVFLLGTHAWRVVRVEQSTVRVVDADGAPPSIPFWFGESPGRTFELSSAVSRLYESVLPNLLERDADGARGILTAVPGVSEGAAEQVVAFLSRNLDVLGDLPTQTRLIVEQFFDETGSTQFVVHAPFGARINRALGLALRKRFCVTFDFELQAAADDDAITIALGPQHSMDLSRVLDLVKSANVADVLTQAVLPLPMLTTRWRWNGVRSLAISRTRSGKKKPIQFIRMDAEDLMAAVWPSLAACQENAPAGPIPVPNHVLVRQTVADTMFEPLDLRGVTALLERYEAGDVRVHVVTTPEPSPLAHGILNGRPYTFLDDAPLEERRSRAVPTPRTLGVTDENGLPITMERNALDPELVAEVVALGGPRVRNRDELADFLHTYFAMRPVPEWQSFFDELVREGRALIVDGVWISATRPNVLDELREDDEAAAMLISAHLEAAGPVTIEDLTAERPLGAGPLRGAPLTVLRAATALAALEGRGYAVKVGLNKWCTRQTFQRLNARARRRRRHDHGAVSIASYVNFLSHWQHVAPGTQLTGRDGVLEVIRQLQGMEIAAGEWEHSILPTRVADYDPRWLDELCFSGEIGWVRLSPKTVADDAGRGAVTPSASTPLTLAQRDELPWLLRATRHKTPMNEPQVGPAADIFNALVANGALFRSDMRDAVGTRLPTEIDEGLWDLVARGYVTADSFHAVRALLRAKRPSSTHRNVNSRLVRGVHRAPTSTGSGEGRWSLVRTPEGELTRLELEDLGEAVATQLLLRWGIATYELFDREGFAVSWLYVGRALRRMEAQGQIVGGRFVEGLQGEQYAHPEALALLRSNPAVVPIEIAACDPLNLTGGILAGTRVPARVNKRVRIDAGRGEEVDYAVASSPS